MSLVYCPTRSIGRPIIIWQPCAIGVTCDGQGNKIYPRRSERAVQKTTSLWSRQTGEEFASDAPPDCRVEINPDGCVETDFTR